MINFLAFQVNDLARLWSGRHRSSPFPLERPNLTGLAQQEPRLPQFVRQCPVAMKYLHLLGPLDWANFPERPANRAWPGPAPHLRAPFVAAYLVKLNEGHTYMSDLRAYLVEHPALVWLLGFKLKADPTRPYGFQVEASVPSRKQLGRVLRDLDNAALQFLLDSTVHLIGQSLPSEVRFGERIALDTKHILAWVKENNPKAYVKEADRLNKTRQPSGDRTCKLGCKKKRNRGPETDPASETTRSTTPNNQKQKRATNFSQLDVYYWGYASGVVATKVPDYGEYVLAELTQTFDRADPTYFFPLLEQTERRLGRRPRFGALDAAFDAGYVHEYFAQAGGFSAVPLTEKGGFTRTFDDAGRPLCEAGLPMPCRSTYVGRRGLIPQRQGRYACPLLFPQPTGQTCPLNHKNWPKGGCLSTMGVSAGARIRYILDRHSTEYKWLYNQRTATERINALALELGIERPKLRNLQAISNQNTLIYVLINLRAYHRLCRRDN